MRIKAICVMCLEHIWHIKSTIISIGCDNMDDDLGGSKSLFHKTVNREKGSKKKRKANSLLSPWQAWNSMALPS